jgi:hypothetical protein
LVHVILFWWHKIVFFFNVNILIWWISHILISYHFRVRIFYIILSVHCKWLLFFLKASVWNCHR